MSRVDGFWIACGNQRSALPPGLPSGPATAPDKPGRDRISSERATHRPRARFGHHPAVPTLRCRRPFS